MEAFALVLVRPRASNAHFKMSKQATYAALVAQRKVCHACAGLTNPADLDGGSFDTDHIGPWSRWQGNLDAKLMIIGQDWGDTCYYCDNRGWDKLTKRDTNQTLMKLLNSIGNLHRPPGTYSKPTRVPDERHPLPQRG